MVASMDRASCVMCICSCVFFSADRIIVNIFFGFTFFFRMNSIEALVFPGNDLNEEKAGVFLSLCDAYLARETIDAYHHKLEGSTFSVTDLNSILALVRSNDRANLFFEETAANILAKTPDKKVKIDCAFYIIELNQNDLHTFVKPQEDTRPNGTHQRIRLGSQSMKRSASSASYLNNVDMKQPADEASTASANVFHYCLNGCCNFGGI